MRRMVPHHDHRGVFVAGNQQARLFPDRHRNRAHDLGHAFPAQPVFGLREQGLRHCFVRGVEIAEHARSGAHALFGGQFEREFVDMRGDTAGRLAVAFGDEQFRAGMAEEGVAPGIDQLELLGAQLRNAVGNLLGKATSQIDEFGAPALARDRTDTYFSCHDTVTPRSA